MGKKKRTQQKKAETGIERSSPKQQNWILSLIRPRNLILGLILGVTLVTFANTVTNKFAYDDQSFILDNQLLHSFSNLPTVLTKELWFYRVLQDKDPNKDVGPTTPYYRPAFSVFHMICWHFFENRPEGWHVVNVLVHMLAVYFVFLILELLTADLTLSAIAALLFAIHPLRVESVAWICGVSDPFLAIFLLPSLYFYLRFRGERKLKFLAFSLVFFLLAAFTKEPAIVLPVFFATYEMFVINQERTFRQRVKYAIAYSAPYALAASFYLVARYFALGFAFNNSNFKSYPPYQVLLTIPLVIWKYLGLLVWPVDLSLFHATNLVKSPLDLAFILPILGLVALGVLLWALRRSMLARFAVLWFAINLLPVLNLSAFAEDFMVQERYVYIPSIGFSILVAMGLMKLPVEKWLHFRNRRVAQVSIVAALVFLLAGKSLALNTTWKDDITVWSHGAETAPEQPISHFILAHKLIVRGQYEKAKEQFDEYMKLRPDNAIVIGNLAALCVLLYQGQAAVNQAAADRTLLDRALALGEQGMKLAPNAAPLWDSVGQVYTFETSLKNYDRALGCFQRGLSLDPANSMIAFHLGATYIKRGNFDEGIPYLQATIKNQPEIVDAHKFLAYAYRGKGQIKDALDELRLYLRLQPNASDYARVSKDIQDLQAQLEAPSPQS